MDYRLVEHRAALSQGCSSDEICRSVAHAAISQIAHAGVLLDVGRGHVDLWSCFRGLVDRYVGMDIVEYKGFPSEAEFVRFDVESADVPLQGAISDVVCAVETTEHLENPRKCVRYLVRWCRPGG